MTYRKVLRLNKPFYLKAFDFMKDTNPLALDFSKLQKALTALEVMAVETHAS